MIHSLCAALGVFLLAACNGQLASSLSPSVPSLHLLVAGIARLPGLEGSTACSHGEPAAADGHRWCAFYRPDPATPARTELWVIDVTRAMTGETLPCDGSSSACLRLTGDLFTEFRFESISHPGSQRFEGDTLLFLAAPYSDRKDLNRYEGTIWAWRPGWQRPRAITTEKGVLCRGSQTAAVAHCVDNASDEPTQFDLRAGRIVDRDDSQLPLIERISPLHLGSLAWTAAFSPTGDLLGYSTWRDGEATEDLRVIATDGPQSKASHVIIADGRDWRLSPDGQTVYFKRALSADERTGTLWSADFPSGQHPAALFSGVHDFDPTGNAGVAFRTDIMGLEGILHAIPDRRRPDQSFTVAKGAHAWQPLDVSRYTYVLQVDQAGQRGLIGDVETGTTCQLESRANVTAFSAILLPSLGSVTWTEPDPADSGLEVAYLGRAADCMPKRPLGLGVTLVQPVGTTGLIFGKKLDPEGAVLSFHYAAVFDESPLEKSATLIIDQVDSTNVGTVGREPEALVLGTVDKATGGQNLFVFGPLPTRAR